MSCRLKLWGGDLFLFFLVGTLLMIPAQAASVLNFPRLSFEPSTLTGLAIVNPTTQAAQVTITAYGADGQLLAGIQNPAFVDVPANQQVPKLTSDLFGSGLDPAVAWFQATSPVDGLTGFFLFLDPAFTVLDGADLPLAGEEIIFSHVRLDSGYSSELNIINPNSIPAQLQLELHRVGQAPLNKNLSLAARGAARLDAGTFFEVADGPSNAFVRVSSDVEVAGFEFVRAPQGDLVGLNARAGSEQLTHLYLPQIAVLQGFETRAGIINNSDQAVVLTLTAFKPDGSIYGPENVQDNPMTQSLAPGQSLLADVATLFGFSGTQLLEGWLKVESTSAALTGFLTYGAPAAGAAAAVTPVRVGQTRGIFSHIATLPGFFTGVAVLNPGQLAANVRILAIATSGNVLGSFGTVLQPGERISKLIDGIIPAAVDQNGGIIFVRSDLPVFLTSVFGTGNLTVLSNVPPQTAPGTYNPDAALESIKVNPPLAIVQPQKSQSFSITGAAVQNVVWNVNGIPGGSSIVGNISSQGNYTAPASVPRPRTVTVTAEGDGQTAGASVDVLEKTALLTSELVVQSVAYLGSLQKLYTAELELLSSSQNALGISSEGPAQTVQSSQIFEVPGPGQPKISLRSFPSEKIAKMIPFRAFTGQEFLLLAAQTSGKVIRFNPQTNQSRDVVTGLNQPSALVIDPSTKNLLVAEQDKVTIVAKTQLESDLTSSARNFGDERGPARTTFFSVDGADGIVVDQCTGDIYVSDGQDGIIRRYLAERGIVEVFISNLQQPGQLLALYRSGITCPQSFHLLVIEKGLNQVTLLTPPQQLTAAWISAFQSTDLTFLVKGGSFSADSAAVLLSELAEGQQVQQEQKSSVSLVDVPDLYGEEPVNKPPAEELSGVPVTFSDDSLAACVRAAFNLTGAALVTSRMARGLTELDCSFQKIQQIDSSLEKIRLLDGLEAFVNLKKLVLRGNEVTRGQPLAALENLEILDAAEGSFRSVDPGGDPTIELAASIGRLVRLKELDLTKQRLQVGFGLIKGIVDLRFTADLVNLEVLKLGDNQIADLTPLSTLTTLRILELQQNEISDIKPLVDNPGLASGDRVDLKTNNLDSGDCPNLKALTDRGVQLQHDVTCN